MKNSKPENNKNEDQEVLPFFFKKPKREDVFCFLLALVGGLILISLPFILDIFFY